MDSKRRLLDSAESSTHQSHLPRSGSQQSIKRSDSATSLRRLDSSTRIRGGDIPSINTIPIVEAGKSYAIGASKGANYKIGSTHPSCIMRVRPLFPHESFICKQVKVEVLDRESLAFATSDKPVQDDLMNLTQDKLFRAHRNFKSDDRNVTLANEIFPKTIDSLLHGISHAFMTLGAEGSGKSHTIFGSLSDPGLILYFANALLKRKLKETSEILITMSVVKFDDEFQDLLCPTGEPLIFKNTKATGGTMCMPTLTRVKIDNLKDFFVNFRLVLKKLPGKCFHADDSQKEKNRKNPERHHTLISFKITNRVFEKIKQEDEGGSYGNLQGATAVVGEERTEQKLYESEMIFIDTDHVGLLEKKEQHQLQQSMFALENVMQYVYEINKNLRAKATHLPYDDSKFTSYLKRYLFGDNQITFLGALSPFIDHMETSMRTAKLIQWVYNSKNSVQQRVTVGHASYKKAPPKDVGFIKRMQTHSNDIEGEVQTYLSSMSLRAEDKTRYCESLLNLLRKFKYHVVKNIKISSQLLAIRDKLKGLQNEYLQLQYDAIQHCVKSGEVREIYLIRQLPKFHSGLVKQLEQLRHSIVQITREISSLLERSNTLTSELKQQCEELTTTQSELRSTHAGALSLLGQTIIAFARWSIDNAIRAYEAPDSNRMDVWNKEIAGKTLIILDQIIQTFDVNDHSTLARNNNATATISSTTQYGAVNFAGDQQQQKQQPSSSTSLKLIPQHPSSRQNLRSTNAQHSSQQQRAMISGPANSMRKFSQDPSVGLSLSSSGNVSGLTGIKSEGYMFMNMRESSEEHSDLGIAAALNAATEEDEEDLTENTRGGQRHSFLKGTFRFQRDLKGRYSPSTRQLSSQSPGSSKASKLKLKSMGTLVEESGLQSQSASSVQLAMKSLREYTDSHKQSTTTTMNQKLQTTTSKQLNGNRRTIDQQQYHSDFLKDDTIQQQNKNKKLNDSMNQLLAQEEFRKSVFYERNSVSHNNTGLGANNLQVNSRICTEETEGNEEGDSENDEDEDEFLGLKRIRNPTNQSLGEIQNDSVQDSQQSIILGIDTESKKNIAPKLQQQQINSDKNEQQIPKQAVNNNNKFKLIDRVSSNNSNFAVFSFNRNAVNNQKGTNMINIHENYQDYDDNLEGAAIDSGIVKKYSRDDLRRIEEELKRKKQAMQAERKRFYKDIERGMQEQNESSILNAVGEVNTKGKNSTVSTGGGGGGMNTVRSNTSSKGIFENQRLSRIGRVSMPQLQLQNQPKHSQPPSLISSVFESQQLTWRGSQQKSVRGNTVSLTSTNASRKGGMSCQGQQQQQPKVSMRYDSKKSKKSGESGLTLQSRIIVQNVNLNRFNSQINLNSKEEGEEQQQQQQLTERRLSNEGIRGNMRNSALLLEKITSKKSQPKAVMGLLKMQLCDTIAYLSQNQHMVRQQMSLKNQLKEGIYRHSMDGPSSRSMMNLQSKDPIGGVSSASNGNGNAGLNGNGSSDVHFQSSQSLFQQQSPSQGMSLQHKQQLNEGNNNDDNLFLGSSLVKLLPTLHGGTIMSSSNLKEKQKKQKQIRKSGNWQLGQLQQQSQLPISTNTNNLGGFQNFQAITQRIGVLADYRIAGAAGNSGSPIQNRNHFDLTGSNKDTFKKEKQRLSQINLKEILVSPSFNAKI